MVAKSSARSSSLQTAARFRAGAVSERQQTAKARGVGCRAREPRLVVLHALEHSPRWPGEKCGGKSSIWHVWPVLYKELRVGGFQNETAALQYPCKPPVVRCRKNSRCFGIGRMASGKAQQFGYGLCAQGRAKKETLAEAGSPVGAAAGYCSPVSMPSCTTSKMPMTRAMFNDGSAQSGAAGRLRIHAITTSVDL